MQVTPVAHGLEHLIGKSGPRTGGLHASTLYGSLFEELEPKRFTGGTPDPLRLEAGLAFETFLEDAIRERLGVGGGRPGELIGPHGILFNPDLLIYGDDVDLRVGEIKLTWLSMKEWPSQPTNGFPPKADKYLCQMMMYCEMLETPYSRLIGYFVNGTYKPMAPQMGAWDITFTKQEMQDNWNMVTNHGKQKGLL